MNYYLKETIKDWSVTCPMVCLGGEYSIFCEEVKNGE